MSNLSAANSCNCSRGGNAATCECRIYVAGIDEFPVCQKCGQAWQLLDWGCALHRLTCGDVEIPVAERDKIVANAAAHGQKIRFM